MAESRGDRGRGPGGSADPPSLERAIELSLEFSRFLEFGALDQQLLDRHRSVLEEGKGPFLSMLAEYLAGFPETVAAMMQWEAEGEPPSQVIDDQVERLFALGRPSANDDALGALEAGGLHHRRGLQPSSTIGTYLLTMLTFRDRIRGEERIAERDKLAVEDAVARIVTRDLALTLQGYWEANQRTLQTANEYLAQAQDHVARLLANIPQILWSVDVATSELSYVSPHAEQLSRGPTGRPVPCLHVVEAEDRDLVERAWGRALNGAAAEVEVRIPDVADGVSWYRFIFYPQADSAGHVRRVDGLIENVTEAREARHRLETMATTDALTGLPNRTLLSDRLAQSIAAADRSATRREIVLLLMDLNGFKAINDTLGHPAGDRVLRLVSDRLRKVVRQTDTVARLGGDEFGILLSDVSDGRAAGRLVAENLAKCFDRPFDLDGRELFLNAALGISIYPWDGEVIDEMLSRADVAMYSSKVEGLDYRFYDPQLDPDAERELDLSAHLRYALDRRELALYYQPQVDLRTGAVVGAEALMRWFHPTLGLVSPETFIPLAERSGMIKPMTNWAIQTAARECMGWIQRGWPMRVAANVSARAFQDPNLIDRITAALKRAGATPGCLEIEITEHTLMRNMDQVRSTLEQLSRLGTISAIDDFGTGYSSLAYLNALPLHTLKIDRSFVMSMPDDEDASAIVRTVIDLGHSLGYRVVAEGVESNEHLEILRSLGCDFGQGHFICRPLATAEFEAWLSRRVALS